MNRATAIALTVVISVSLASAQETSEKLFRDLENKIAHAFITKDATQLNQLLTSDYISVDGSGQMWSRAEIVDAFISGRRTVSAPHIEKITVRQYADTAIVVGFLTMSGKDADKDISGRYAFTRVYKKDVGEWRAVSFQVTLVK